MAETLHGRCAEHSESVWKCVRDGGTGDSCSGVLVGSLGALAGQTATATQGSAAITINSTIKRRQK
jgi:hypothetical protein